MKKVQTANSQLFSGDSNQHATNGKQSKFLQPKHRVTFSSDIEEYDDHSNVTDDDSASYRNEQDAEANEIAESLEQSERNEDDAINAIDDSLQNLSIDEIYSDANSLEEEYATELEVNNDISLEFDGNSSSNQLMHSSSKPSPPSSTTNANSKHIHRSPPKQTSTSTQHKCKRNRPTSAKPFKCHTNKSVGNIFNIHLNIKSCCKHKLTDDCRLPRYNGYTSQYGLSKDQLEWREMNGQRCRVNRMRQQRQIIHAKQEISDLNEQAFRQWLIRKDRLAKPKYKNMYDFGAK